MSKRELTFSIENLKAFKNFEDKLVEENYDKQYYLMGNESFSEGLEEFKLRNNIFDSFERVFEKFLAKASKDKPHKSLVKYNGILHGNRTTGIVSATRGNDISVNRDIYDYLEDEIGGIIDSNIPNIRKFIGTYIGNHMTEMSYRGPGKKLIWIETDEYFKVSGVSRKLVEDAIKKSEYINPKWEISNNPLNMLMTYQIFHCWNNITEAEKKALNGSNKEYRTSTVYLLTLIFVIRFYSSLNIKYFSHEADEELMNKTIENLSDRYTLNKYNLKNIFDLLEFFAYSNINNTIELMETPTDFNMVYYMDNLNNRINNTIRSVANAYYDNYENGLKVQTEKMQGTSEDGDTYLNVSDSVSANIEIIVRKLAIKLSSDSTVIDRILDIACRETKIGKNKMKITIQNMITNDKEYVIDLMRKIIIYYIGYLKKDKKTIHSINFISIMKRTYNVSNTKDQGLIDIKNALHELMKRNSAEYLKTERVATLSNMKACCFYYWLLYVNEKVE